MSCEIELKAHIPEDRVESIINELKHCSYAEYLGKTDKEDIYWNADGSDSPLFRTRLEKTDSGSRVLFTSKPSKTKNCNVEYNLENEFAADAEEWDAVLAFCRGLNLNVCRRKFKNGVHFNCRINGYEIHTEVFEVKYLGWFIESEIIVDSTESGIDKRAEKALCQLLDNLNIPKESVESKGYNKLLKEVGHLKG